MKHNSMRYRQVNMMGSYRNRGEKHLPEVEVGHNDRQIPEVEVGPNEMQLNEIVASHYI
jgi:hypothetical protein